MFGLDAWATFNWWINSNPHERIGLFRQRSMFSRKLVRESLRFITDFQNRLFYLENKGVNVDCMTMCELDHEYVQERYEQFVKVGLISGLLSGGCGVNQAIPTDSEYLLLKATAEAEFKNIKTVGRPGYLSNSESGPVLTALRDNITGEIVTARNVLEIPLDLHPVLRQRLIDFARETGGNYPHFSVPGTHSEVIALDKALKAREAAGMTVVEANLEEFSLYNVWLRGANRGLSIPRCKNCSRITCEVKSFSGDVR